MDRRQSVAPGRACAAHAPQASRRRLAQTAGLGGAGRARPGRWIGVGATWPTARPRPDRRRRHPHRRPVRHRVGQPGRGGDLRRDRGGPRPARPPDGHPDRQHPRRPHRARSRRAGRPRRPHRHRAAHQTPPTCPPGARATTSSAAGTVDMKGGVAVQLKAALRAGAEPRPHLRLLRGRGDRQRSTTGCCTSQQQRPELIADADFAVLLEPTASQVEGGCKGTLRVDVDDQGCRRPLRPPVERPQRHPRRRAGPHPAHRLRGATRHRRRARLPRGHERHRHPRRHRRQRHPRRVRRHGQLPVCAGQVRRTRPRPTSEGLFEGYDVVGPRQRAGRPARARPARRQGVRRRARPCRSWPRRAGPTSPASPRWASPP